MRTWLGSSALVRRLIAPLPRRVPALEQHAQRRAEDPPADQSAKLQPKREQSSLSALKASGALVGLQAERQIRVGKRAHATNVRDGPF